MKLCACGCGQATKLSDRTDRKRGVVRGQPLNYVNGHSWRGRLRSPIVPPVWQDCGHETQCLVWQGQIHRTTGYGYMRDHSMAHRAYYELQHGPIPAGMQLDHLCRNRACVNPAHLEVVTNAENARRGDKTKLTRADVDAIRRSSLTTLALGHRFGVHPAHISKIRTGKRWVAA